MQKSVY